MEKYYLLEDFENRADNQLRPAQLIESNNGTLWSQINNQYSLYIEGRQVGGNTHKFIRYDLLVYDTILKKYYLLEDFEIRADNQLRPAKKIRNSLYGLIVWYTP